MLAQRVLWGAAAAQLQMFRTLIRQLLWEGTTMLLLLQLLLLVMLLLWGQGLSSGAGRPDHH